jgi:hypothetical protein
MLLLWLVLNNKPEPLKLKNLFNIKIVSMSKCSPTKPLKLNWLVENFKPPKK